MFIKKIINMFKNRSRKLKQLHSSFISSLFSGAIIGIFFSLTTKTSFEGWNPFSNFGWIQYLIYFTFLIVLLLLFFWYGKGLMTDNEERYNFCINYIMGVFTALITAFFITYHLNIKILLWAIGITVISFLIISYLIVKYVKR